MNQFKRVSSPELDSILGNKIPVLDHGFIRPIDYMGNDTSVVQAARVSYGSGTKTNSEDEGLIRYLMRHHHSTPMEMCELKLHIKAPIFVARQWLRHRMSSTNEYSARYSMMQDMFYLPDPANLTPQSKTNAQGRNELVKLSEEESKKALEILESDANHCYENYLNLTNTDAQGNVLDDSKQGIARELARMNLPVSIYTEWYWKIDLHNLFHFLRLRADSHAQYEIRVYAEAIEDIVAQWVPMCFRAYKDYRKNAINFSAEEVNILRTLVNNSEAILMGLDDLVSESNLSKREKTELFNKLT